MDTREIARRLADEGITVDDGRFLKECRWTYYLSDDEIAEVEAVMAEADEED